MQERSHAFAMKSQIWLLDPRPHLPSIVQAVKLGFELSEASSTPVMLMLRIRACHVHGHFKASDNRKPTFSLEQALEAPHRDVNRIVLPPASFLHEREKLEQRWPAAVQFITQNRINEFEAEDADDIGLILQGGLYNTVLRSLERLGLADTYGNTRVPLYIMNVTYPIVTDEVLRFCHGKRAVLMIEEGQPNFIEQNVATILRAAGSETELHGKGDLPVAGEYTAAVVMQGLERFLVAQGRHSVTRPKVIPIQPATPVHVRPPGFCTGCPERPIFTALKLVERDLGTHHVSADIGCHLFSILPPFNIGNTTMGYGLGGAGAAALNTSAKKRAISFMGDGGFWHNGLTSGVANSVFNRSNNLTVIVDNSYTSATGGQDILSSKAANPSRSTGHAIEKAVRGVGVNWVRTVRHTYDLKSMMAALRDGLTSKESGPKVLIAQSECMLNRQRREKPLQRKAIDNGNRVVRERFGVDAETCTGDHSCIRLSGCPSLTIKPNPDPLRTDPVASVVDSCVGCGLCGEVAHAAVLCPSFFKSRVVVNPSGIERWLERLRRSVITWLQRRDDLDRSRWVF
jgi:indolepyruvate ferredoxin oxidoreductase alpha subunit